MTQPHSAETGPGAPKETPPGWSARSVVALGMAALAFGFAFAFLYEDRAAAPGAEGIAAFVTGTLLFHALGGAVAGWALAGLFGRAGAFGWPLAALGGALASIAAGVLGGAASGLPDLLGSGSTVAGAMRIATAAFVTPLAVAAAPWLGAVWLAIVLGLHIVTRRLRG
jgi:hypothetical protein